MNNDTTIFKEFKSFCFELQDLEKNEAISYDESNVPVIIHGLNEPRSEQELKRASKRLVKCFLETIQTNSEENVQERAITGMVTLISLKMFLS